MAEKGGRSFGSAEQSVVLYYTDCRLARTFSPAALHELSHWQRSVAAGQ
jgi:elongation factor P hydroxylase